MKKSLSFHGQASVQTDAKGPIIGIDLNLRPAAANCAKPLQRKAYAPPLLSAQWTQGWAQPQKPQPLMAAKLRGCDLILRKS